MTMTAADEIRSYCAWMRKQRATKISNAAAALGRLGGSVKSKAKTAAARANGAKSKGWPKGKKRGPRKVRPKPTASQPPSSAG